MNDKNILHNLVLEQSECGEFILKLFPIINHDLIMSNESQTNHLNNKIFTWLYKKTKPNQTTHFNGNILKKIMRTSKGQTRHKNL